MNLFDKLGLFFMLGAIYAQVYATAFYWPGLAVFLAAAGLERSEPDMFGGQWEE